MAKNNELLDLKKIYNSRDDQEVKDMLLDRFFETLDLKNNELSKINKKDNKGE